MDKLYIVTRADLPPGAIAAQSVHTALAFAVEHPEIFRQWHLGSNNIVLLSVPDRGALLQLEDRAIEAEIECANFIEPDFDDTITGVAIGPRGARLVSNLPLALRPPKAA